MDTRGWVALAVLAVSSGAVACSSSDSGAADAGADGARVDLSRSDAAEADGTPDDGNTPGDDSAAGDGGASEAGTDQGSNLDGWTPPPGPHLATVTLPACGSAASPPTGVWHIRSVADWAKVNDAALTTFCVHAGDYTAAGDIRLTASGTTQTPRVIRFFEAPPKSTPPWRRPVAERALVARLELDGASHWVIERLAIGATTKRTNLLRLGAGATFNVVHRCLLQTGGGGGGQISIGGDDNVVQASVLRETIVSAGDDNHCIKVSGGAKRTRIVQNEIYDCAGDGIQIGSAPLPVASYEGTVIAGNDIYCEKLCGKGENGVDLKGAGGSGEANWLRIVDNRIWGRMAGGGSSSGATNQGLIDVSAELQQKGHVLVRGNVLFENDYAIKPEKGQPSDPGRSHHWSIIGNLIFDIGERAIDLGHNSPSAEIYYNTIVELAAGKRWYSDYQSSTGGDVRCNLLVDARGSKSEAAQVVFSHNALVGQTDPIGTDNLVSTRPAAGLRDYCFVIKQLTAPQLRCIPAALPTKSSTVASGCPKDVGQRKGVGLDDGSPSRFVGPDGKALGGAAMGALRPN
jgi:hypothetical protein